MKKMLITLLVISMFSPAIATEGNPNAPKPRSTFVDKIKAGVSQTPSYLKEAGSYLFSAKGAKDLALAYCFGMGLTAIHEGGHAVTAKILCGTRIQLVLGAAPHSGHPTYLAIGGVSLGGFNPTTGYADTRSGRKPPLKDAAISAAGPICGALGSLTALLLLRKYDSLYITKAAAAYGLSNHTIGIAGVGGIWKPGTDANRIVRMLSNYRASFK